MKLIQQPTPEDTAFALLARRIELRERDKLFMQEGWENKSLPALESDSQAMGISESAEAAELKEEIVAKIGFGLNCFFAFLAILAVATIGPIFIFGGQ
ncbi:MULTISPECIES: hypothetical protein [unclassified Psychrobacter]|uniref:hypothetical protein n=1 Tax=unclassified Psychrobacter TaxID=196806 RepID=UPI0018F7B8B6|nr:MULTISPECIES: hypothetical protein [unclassified Psychrobacter]